MEIKNMKPQPMHESLLDRFKAIFGCDPDKYENPCPNDPYFFQSYGQEGYMLLEYFGICPMCDGMGVAYTECCNGHRCECQGQPVSFSCQRCNGTGRLQQEDNPDSNRKYIEQVATIYGGYMYPKQELPF